MSKQAQTAGGVEPGTEINLVLAQMRRGSDLRSEVETRIALERRKGASPESVAASMASSLAAATGRPVEHCEMALVQLAKAVH